MGIKILGRTTPLFGIATGALDGGRSLKIRNGDGLQIQITDKAAELVVGDAHRNRVGYARGAAISIAGEVGQRTRVRDRAKSKLTGHLGGAALELILIHHQRAHGTACS